MQADKIGRFLLRSELGRGEAAVYRAYDPVFQRDVAIKVLPHEEMQGLETQARFRRELKVIASLEHPAIVPVYDVGETEEGRTYFVMRYMSGGSLEDLIRQEKKISLQDTAVIIERLAFAADYAHKKGIVHRDLKPANILFDSNHYPYISDFGIASLLMGNEIALDSHGMGTPLFASPEQGLGQPNDHRTDVYTLGVTIFEMLTGRRPYEYYKDDGSPASHMAVIQQHIHDPIPNILKLEPDLPPLVQTIIETAMAKDREDRYSSIIDLARALNVAAFGETAFSPGSALEKELNVFHARRTRVNLLARIKNSLSVLSFVFTRRFRTSTRQLNWPKSVRRRHINELTLNLLTVVDPRKRQEILSLIGREHVLRIKDKIIHFGGGRYLLHGYGRFGATALIDQIVKIVGRNVASFRQGAGNSVTMTVRIDASSVKEADNAIDAVIRELRFETQRGKYSRSFARQINRLYKNGITEVKDEEQTISIKAAPIRGIAAQFSRKLSLPDISSKGNIKEENLLQLIVDFLDQVDKSRPASFETLADMLLNKVRFPARLIFVIDKINSSIVFDLLRQMRLFHDERISFFAIVKQETFSAWAQDGMTLKMTGELGFQNYYLPCLWEEEIRLVNMVIEEAFSLHQVDAQVRDFIDHVAFVARGSPGDVFQEIARAEYLEYNPEGVPLLNLKGVRNWATIIANAKIQQILTRNWQQILEYRFNAADKEEKDQARRAIYEMIDWIHSRKIFTLEEIYDFARNTPLPISTSADLTLQILDLLINILLEEKYLITNQKKYGVADRIKPSDLVSPRIA